MKFTDKKNKNGMTFIDTQQRNNGTPQENNETSQKNIGTPKINVILADNSTFIREGVIKILEKEPDIHVNCYVSSSKQLMVALNEGKYDILLLSLELPDRQGIDVLKEIKKQYPKLKVIVFTIFKNHHLALRIIQSGAMGYITKDSDPHILSPAIKIVNDGGIYICPELAHKLFASLISGSNKVLEERLSDRESQVLLLIASGKSINEIAELLSISKKTVSTHREHMLKKMCMKNNAEITRFALTEGLLK